MQTSIVVEFPDQTPASRTVTSYQRLKDIAEFLAISENEAVHYAINKAWHDLAEHEDMCEELAFVRQGRKIGRMTFLHHDEAFLACAQQRYDERVPLWDIDDEDLDRCFFLGFFTKEQKQQVQAVRDPLEKRRLIERFIEETDRREGLSFDPS